MRTPLIVMLIVSSFTGFLSPENGPQSEVRILRPSAGDSVAYDQAKLFLASAAKSAGTRLVVAKQWSIEGVFDLAAEDSRKNFAKDFFRIIPPQTTLEQVTYHLVLFQGYAPSETLAFAYADSITIRTLWQNPHFVQLAKEIQTTNASELFISVRGWRDSTYEAVYDDPADDQRTLYKIHTTLLPGRNRIYFSLPGEKNHALEFTTSYAMEGKPTTDRSGRFHNSPLEEGCSTCHDGLPDADKGKSMKADCAVCHKSVSMGKYLHSPVEMKECGSCHSWSAKENAVVLESGVPATCYTCHDDKKDQVENSPNPHPVAGECMTCHSSHGTEQKHIVKQDVYTLCTSCHEHEAENHPVGRHPLRFKVVKQTGQVVSCISCHNPHGSKNQHLLTVAGSAMEVCAQCH